MNIKIFDSIVTWITKEDGGRKLQIPFKNKKYAPQIAINGEKIINGSSWSVFCYTYEFLAPLKTKSYIRFLNINDAPDVIFIGTKFDLFEGGKKVATGEIVNYI